MSSSACALAIAVDADATDAVGRRARVLAGELSLPMICEDLAVDLVLRVRDSGLSLGPPRSRMSISVDFLGGRTAHRRIAGGGKRQPLARALGIPQGIRRVVDATAGLGRDAFQLAALGCTVTGVERSPVLAVLLREAHARASERGSARLGEVLARLQFTCADAVGYLEALDEPQRPEAVYLDPMFPARRATALTRKEMRIVRTLVGDDLDADRVLAAARRAATARVVVKRHPYVDPLAPDIVASHGGTRVRYDVYGPTR